MERFFTGRELVNTSSRLERNAASAMNDQSLFAKSHAHELRKQTARRARLKNCDAKFVEESEVDHVELF